MSETRPNPMQQRAPQPAGSIAQPVRPQVIVPVQTLPADLPPPPQPNQVLTAPPGGVPSQVSQQRTIQEMKAGRAALLARQRAHITSEE